MVVVVETHVHDPYDRKVMKLVTAVAMQEVDHQAISEFEIPVSRLMENAGRAVAEDVLAHFFHSSFVSRHSSLGSVVVVCGKGHNGGDGLVAARYLARAGVEVVVVLAGWGKELKGEPLRQWKKWKALRRSEIEVTKESEMAKVRLACGRAEVIIDALVGTGARLPLTGWAIRLVESLNACGRPVVAVDLPSGLNPDTGEVLGPAVEAYRTVTLGLPKVGLVKGMGPMLAGRITVADIGFPIKVLQGVSGEAEWTSACSIRRTLKWRKDTLHKGEAGKVLVVGGSSRLVGAPALACWGALRAGSGLVYAGVPAAMAHTIQSRLFEVIVGGVGSSDTGTLGLEHEPFLRKLGESCKIVVIGPGMGREPGTVKLVKKILTSWPHPMVVDADALFAIAQFPQMWSSIAHSERLVLTPHEGEMGTLCGKTSDEVRTSRWETAVGWAKGHGCHLVLKGPHTLVVDPQGAIAVNSTGHGGMATAGMGDVLSGVIGSLMGQGYTPDEAARMAVFIHGRAAELAAEVTGPIGLVASDVAHYLPRALREI